MIVALALLGTAFSFREVHGDEVGRTIFWAEGGSKVGPGSSYTWGFLAPMDGRKYMRITGVITLYLLGLHISP